VIKGCRMFVEFILEPFCFAKIQLYQSGMQLNIITADALSHFTARA